MKFPKRILSIALVAVACVFAMAATASPSGGCAAMSTVAADSAAITPTPTTMPANASAPVAAAVTVANVSTSPIAQFAVAAIPWGSAVLAGLGLAASVYLKIQASASGQKAATAETAIATAAPDIVKLANQVSGNNATVGAIAGAATSLAPSIVALLNHPAAVAATSATATPANTTVTPATEHVILDSPPTPTPAFVSGKA